MMTAFSATRKYFCLVLAAALFLGAAGGAYAQGKAVKIGFVKIENSSEDPRYDYLEGIVSGTLLYDLSNAPGLVVVDRALLDNILKEQELILSDLVKADNAVRVGKILGADYLLKGDYVFLGNEIRLNVSIINVESAKTMTFKETGSTENLVHAVCERIIERLTGNQVALRSDEHDRSIISLKDEKPGSIGLFCNLIDAEIFVDDQFVCYSTGKANVPSELTGLKPGKHTVRVRLTGFGVVKAPEITFSDWQQAVDVKPGQRQVVRAQITLFTYQLYDLQKLLSDHVRIEAADFGKPFSKEMEFEYVDRASKKHKGNLKLSLAAAEAQAELKAELTLDGKKRSYSLTCPAKKRTKSDETFGKVDIKLELDYYYPDRYCRIEYRVTRNDISQDMWHKE
ncbi:MAG: hypothetical protein JXD23_14900 [Spirochaetales bacterium]|nr:hypothetical protein [Spirochaetales bacterium]